MLLGIGGNDESGGPGWVPLLLGGGAGTVEVVLLM